MEPVCQTGVFTDSKVSRRGGARLFIDCNDCNESDGFLPRGSHS